MTIAKIDGLISIFKSNSHKNSKYIDFCYMYMIYRDVKCGKYIVLFIHTPHFQNIIERTHFQTYKPPKIPVFKPFSAVSRMQNSLLMAIVIYKIYNLLYYGGSHRKTYRTHKKWGINKKGNHRKLPKSRIISGFPNQIFILERPSACRSGLTEVSLLFLCS